MIRLFALSAILASWALLCPLPAIAGCPPAKELEAIVAGLDLRGTVGTELPAELYGEAAREPGRPAVARRGKHGFGVLVVEMSVERLWMAIADEEHHALELPVQHSEVIGGMPRGVSRRVFQYIRRWGIGRWWVSDLKMDAGVYEASGGRLWQLRWQDAMDTVDRSRPPVSSVAGKITPIRESRGGWLLAPLGENCTLMAYSNLSDPGGVVGSTQWILVPRTLRATLLGVTRLAGSHMEEPHDGPPFLRPDGSTIPPVCTGTTEP
jgi:hypothetical protein